jgi:hypothetical protein
MSRHSHSVGAGGVCASAERLWISMLESAAMHLCRPAFYTPEVALDRFGSADKGRTSG